MSEQERLMKLMADAEKAKAHGLLKILQQQVWMQLAIHQMNAPPLETTALISTQCNCSICKDLMMVGLVPKDRCTRCESAGRWALTQAMERKENRKGLILWCRVMVLASVTGWAIWFVADCLK